MARASGASAAQIAILEAAVDTGDVTFDDARLAVENVIECAADAGVTTYYRVE